MCVAFFAVERGRKKRKRGSFLSLLRCVRVTSLSMAATPARFPILRGTPMTTGSSRLSPKITCCKCGKWLRTFTATATTRSAGLAKRVQARTPVWVSKVVAPPQLLARAETQAQQPQEWQGRGLGL